MSHSTTNKMTIAQLLAQYNPLPKGRPYLDELDDLRDYGLSEFLGEDTNGRSINTDHPDYATHKQAVLIHELEDARHDPEYGLVLSVVTLHGTPVAIVFAYNEDLRDSAVHIINAEAWEQSKAIMKPLIKWNYQSTPYMANLADAIVDIFPTISDYLAVVSQTTPTAAPAFHLYATNDPRINDIIARDEDSNNPFKVTEVSVRAP